MVNLPLTPPPPQKKKTLTETHKIKYLNSLMRLIREIIEAYALIRVACMFEIFLARTG